MFKKTVKKVPTMIINQNREEVVSKERICDICGKSITIDNLGWDKFYKITHEHGEDSRIGFNIVTSDICSNECLKKYLSEFDTNDLINIEISKEYHPLVERECDEVVETEIVEETTAEKRYRLAESISILSQELNEVYKEFEELNKEIQ